MAMNYDYGNKRQWRRWLWNRIAERTENRREGLVLFLAGENAHDIEVAVSKGFHARNMIAVERAPDVCARLRSSGVLTIAGDLVETVRAWGHDRQISAVVGDFCCGLHSKIMSDLGGALLTNPAFWDATIAVNFLRGRDATMNDVRQNLQELAPSLFDKHRGSLFCKLMLLNCCPAPEDVDHNADIVWAGISAVEDAARPSFTSYKSTAGNQVFDTAVFKNPMSVGRSLLGNQVMDALGSQMKDRGFRTGQRRKIAAVLAHHARRQPGWA